MSWAPAFAAEGDLDTSFGSGGVAASPPIDVVGNGMTIDGQGRIVVVGGTYGESDIAVTRFLASGVLDPAFSGDGLAVFDSPAGNLDDTGYAVTTDALGGILVAGEVQDTTDGNPADYVLIRVAPDGSLDTGFGPPGSGGFVTTDFNSDVDVALGVVTDSAGRIVVGGNKRQGDSDFGVARYDPKGILDTSFGTGGRRGVDFTPGGGDQDLAHSIAVDAQGRIVLAGSSTASGADHVALARLTSTGANDPAFGTDGKVTTPFGTTDVANSVLVDPQGKILIAGRQTNDGASDFAVARYNDDGSLDPTFSGDGKLALPIGDSFDAADDLAVDRQGRIIVVGTSAHDVYSFPPALARIDPSGALDRTFGNGGTLVLPIRAAALGTLSVAIDDHDRIAIAGGPLNLGAARLIGDAVAPVLTIGAGPADGARINDSTPTFEFTSSEAGGTFGCGLDGLLGSCSSPFAAAAPLGDGQHTFSLSATDRAGNASPTQTRTFTIDTQAPEIDINAKSKVKTQRKKTRTKLKITISEPAELTCAVDKRRPEECLKKFITPKLKKGKHKVVVEAIDLAGNSSDEKQKIKVVRKP